MLVHCQYPIYLERHVFQLSFYGMLVCNYAHSYVKGERRSCAHISLCCCTNPRKAMLVIIFIQYTVQLIKFTILAVSVLKITSFHIVNVVTNLSL